MTTVRSNLRLLALIAIATLATTSTPAVAGGAPLADGAPVCQVAALGVCWLWETAPATDATAAPPTTPKPKCIPSECKVTTPKPL